MATFIDIDPRFRVDPRTGDIAVSEDTNSIKNSIVGLVLTAFSDRPFEPWLNSPASSMLFKPRSSRDSLSDYMIENIIGQVISNHEPRANFIGSTVTSSSPNEIRINVRYQVVEDPEQEQQLEIRI